MQQFGKLFIIIGILLVGIGLVFVLGIKIPYFGKLPGDIRIEKDNFTFYFPLATCIVASVILTLILNFLFKK